MILGLRRAKSGFGCICSVASVRGDEHPCNWSDEKPWHIQSSPVRLTHERGVAARVARRLGAVPGCRRHAPRDRRDAYSRPTCPNKRLACSRGCNGGFMEPSRSCPGAASRSSTAYSCRCDCPQPVSTGRSGETPRAGCIAARTAQRSRQLGSFSRLGARLTPECCWKTRAWRWRCTIAAHRSSKRLLDGSPPKRSQPWGRRSASRKGRRCSRSKPNRTARARDRGVHAGAAVPRPCSRLHRR